VHELFSTRWAGVLRDRSEYSEAEPLYVRLLRLREAAFGADSAELISTLDSLSYVYFGLKALRRRATRIRAACSRYGRPSAGPGHPMIALTLDKMAEFFAAQRPLTPKLSRWWPARRICGPRV